MSQISQIKKIYHAAIYVRLSKEDGAVASHEKTESNSIANQKSLIRDFLENKNDIEVVQEYVDDGFSGSNFERPAFQMMLEDIKKGKIDCVVTKDLSRFGREYIDSGMYIERLFPAMGVRFIAINDGIDSGEAKSQSDEIIIPFKNLINDAYCRDISIKIRSHLEIKRKQGDVITAFVPYGYKKNDKDKHKLEIDVYAANVVKDIFRMKLHGKSQDAIACELNSSGILPPAEYKASTGSNYQTCFKTKEKSEWTSVMVRRILTNEVYIGNLVQGKQTTPNHKVKKTIIKEKCEWIRIEKNHEPVITDRDFEVVQRLLAMDTRTSPDREEVYPLSGVVTCGGCGIPMVRKTSKVGGKTYAYYLCATHKDSKQCSSHRISTDKLEEVVLELLQTHIDNMIDLKRILSFIGNVPFQQLDMKKLEERREKKQAEVDRCADLRGMLYEDMKDGIISKEDYKELHTAYEQRKKSAEIAIHQIELEMEDVLNRKSKGFVWLDYFTEHKNIEKLTREVVVSLIREMALDATYFPFRAENDNKIYTDEAETSMMEGMMKVYWYAPEQVKRMQSIWNTNYTERNMLEFFDTKENIDILRTANMADKYQTPMKFRAILENLEKMEETDRRQKIREYNNILAEASERTAKSTSIVDFMLGTTGFLNFGSYLNTILNLLGLLKGVPDMMPGATERKDLQKFRSIAKELGTDNPEKTGEEVYLLDRISPVANLR